jgi:hypothetical protein
MFRNMQYHLQRMFRRYPDAELAVRNDPNHIWHRYLPVKDEDREAKRALVIDISCDSDDSGRKRMKS